MAPFGAQYIYMYMCKLREGADSALYYNIDRCSG